jgi:hypothetical protein
VFYKTLKASGFPRLYTLYSDHSDRAGLLGLHFTKNIEAYDFTFG